LQPLRTPILILPCSQPTGADRDGSQKFIVELDAAERERLSALISKGRAPAKTILKARFLLKADQAEGGPVGSMRKSSRRSTRTRRWYSARARIS